MCVCVCVAGREKHHQIGSEALIKLHWLRDCAEVVQNSVEVGLGRLQLRRRNEETILVFVRNGVRVCVCMFFVANIFMLC